MKEYRFIQVDVFTDVWASRTRITLLINVTRTTWPTWPDCVT